MLDFNRLNAIEAEWAEIEESYRLAPYASPINRSEELACVLEARREGRPYNPCFHEMAFDIATRVKRGFVDTAQPGAHTKDMVYLQGYLAVKAHLAENPDDLPLLMLGKFALQHLPLVREWLAQGLLVPARYLPQDVSNL